MLSYKCVMSKKLTPDTPAPSLKPPLVGGGTFDLSDEKPENFTMVLFYRGLHCLSAKAISVDWQPH